jgi:hypothetical protein
MRRLSSSIPLIICGVALYFTLHWGLDAIRILASPINGLDEQGFARIVLAIARSGEWPPLAVAVFFGAMKLGAAIAFAVYLAHRLCSLGDAEPRHEILETGLVLVTVTIFAMALPVFVQDPGHAFDQYRVSLWMVGLAATLSMVERACALKPLSSRTDIADYEAAILARIPALPRPRGRVSALRWNLLRQQARLIDR